MESNNFIKLKIYLIIILLTGANISATAWAFTGKVIGVADGDTIKIRTVKGDIKIRLYGIDTPEKRQAFGNKAKKITNAMVRGRVVQVKGLDRDRYGRLVALVWVDDVLLNEALIRNGYAWVYRKYCKKSFCSTWLKYEHEARAGRKGMWADPHIIPPWRWRHKSDYAQLLTKRWNAAKPASITKRHHHYSSGVYHGNIKSHKFHQPGCRAYNCKNCVRGFNSREEAISAGYSPCRICNP